MIEHLVASESGNLESTNAVSGTATEFRDGHVTSKDPSFEFFAKELRKVLPIAEEPVLGLPEEFLEKITAIMK